MKIKKYKHVINNISSLSFWNLQISVFQEMEKTL